MENKSFEVYKEDGISMDGSITDGCLHLTSLVYGQYGDSEKYYDFTKKDTEILFDIINLDDFIKSLQKGRIEWLDNFLKENKINVKTFCWVEL